MVAEQTAAEAVVDWALAEVAAAVGAGVAVPCSTKHRDVDVGVVQSDDAAVGCSSMMRT